jgi:hypothetical protein
MFSVKDAVLHEIFRNQISTVSSAKLRCNAMVMTVAACHAMTLLHHDLPKGRLTWIVTVQEL